MKISIQGYIGSFHHEVASKLWGEDVEVLERDNFPDVFSDVQNNDAKYGIVAVENSLVGTMVDNYDLVRANNVRIIGEYYLRIKHNLIVFPGQKLSEIKLAKSHHMALKQCRGFLKKNELESIQVDDTAGAVKEIIEKKEKGIAAIASLGAAKVYGAEVLAEGIEDDPGNFTRFFILTKNSDPKIKHKSKQFKTSIYLEVKHQPGSLQKTLQVFGMFNFNMTMLVSRPIVGKPWEYGFYVDFTHAGEEINSFLEMLIKQSALVKVLGTYPAFDNSLN